jgi:hypothetical protein
MLITKLQVDPDKQASPTSPGRQLVTDAVEELSCVDAMSMIPFSSGFVGRRIDDGASAE